MQTSGTLWKQPETGLFLRSAHVIEAGMQILMFFLAIAMV
ncbi:hypothetical protein X970_10450 [Pseudomonas monteilii SB3101]|uniref:Uncharacterized protein n=1 Tax=Pseudomonas monteilii SB3101 TaxID=1435058 RepID=V9V690_9PSED|nr:hypothetical protein X969_10795 [Pseudomonas monteilii SB3078]AHC91064.1 hypothetical protein X970_10450 [Pseudomonas monteilii SB3101]